MNSPAVRAMARQGRTAVRPNKPLTSKPASAGAHVVLTSSAAAPSGVFECRICKCRGSVITHCRICGNRNCMSQIMPETPPGGAAVAAAIKVRGSLDQAIAEGAKIERIRSGIPKLDRVLGGGFVDRTAILIAGDPGAGKSTLLLQACLTFGGPIFRRVKLPKKRRSDPDKWEKIPTGDFRRVLYISGEEAFDQVGARAARIPGALEKAQYIEFCTTQDVPTAMATVLEVKPHLVVVDSIQEIGDELLSGEFGGKAQSANLIRSIMSCIRQNGFGVAFFVCHVRKDGDIAGAKKAEHLVDIVCKLSIELDEEDVDDEGNEIPLADRTVSDERMLEAYKNRYGSVTERSVFKMTAEGLK